MHICNIVVGGHLDDITRLRNFWKTVATLDTFANLIKVFDLSLMEQVPYIP